MEESIWQISQFECGSIPHSQLRHKSQSRPLIQRSVLSNVGKVFLCHLLAHKFNVYTNLCRVTTCQKSKWMTMTTRGRTFAYGMKALDDHFAPGCHDVYERDIFWAMRPDVDESLVEFVLRVQIQARRCTFDATEREGREMAVIDKITPLAPPDLRKRLLERSHLYLNKMTRLVTSHLPVQKQNGDMNRSIWKMGNSSAGLNDSGTTNKVSSLPKGNTAARQWNQSLPSALGGYNRPGSYSAMTCRAGGYDTHRTGSGRFPAQDQRRLKCGGFNHFAKVP